MAVLLAVVSAAHAADAPAPSPTSPASVISPSVAVGFLTAAVALDMFSQKLSQRKVFKFFVYGMSRSSTRSSTMPSVEFALVLGGTTSKFWFKNKLYCFELARIEPLNYDTTCWCLNPLYEFISNR
ncbi:hypothetical protein CR513_37625, partial [Mucuna pruriens]